MQGPYRKCTDMGKCIGSLTALMGEDLQNSSGRRSGVLPPTQLGHGVQARHVPSPGMDAPAPARLPPHASGRTAKGKAPQPCPALQRPVLPVGAPHLVAHPCTALSTVTGSATSNIALIAT